jgi:hypothetical protein
MFSFSPATTTYFSMFVVRWAAAYPAGACSQTALPAARILRVTPVDGFPAGVAFITVKCIAAVATDKHMIIPKIRINVERSADQAY